MKTKKQNPSIARLSSELPRRTFLGGTLAAGFGLTLGLNENAAANPAAEAPAADECLELSASDMLALFSPLAWRLPHQLQKAELAQQEEQVLYKNFDTHYRKLSSLAAQLKLNCKNLTQNDPKKQLAGELVSLIDKNKQSPRTGVPEGDAVYMHISALVAEQQRIGRDADAILAQASTSDDNAKLICEMISEIAEMDRIKGGLDVARLEFQTSFLSFTSMVRQLNATMIDASQAAAESEQGTGSRTLAVAKIDEANALLDKIIKESSQKGSGVITPQTLRYLLDVPKAILENRLPPEPVTQRLGPGEVKFRNASYNPNAASLKSQIAVIIRDCLVPANGLSVSILSGASFLVIQTYAQNPPREDTVLGVLQSWYYTSPISKLREAARRISRLS